MLFLLGTNGGTIAWVFRGRRTCERRSQSTATSLRERRFQRQIPKTYGVLEAKFERSVQAVGHLLDVVLSPLRMRIEALAVEDHREIMNERVFGRWF